MCIRVHPEPHEAANRDCEVVLANRATAALLGGDEQALLRRPLAEVLAAPAFAPVLTAFATAGKERAGFEPELAERRFLVGGTTFRDEFFREKRRESSDIEGKGLGLAIVKRLVDRAAGRLEVQSQEGVGSTFSVFLPA